MNLLSLFTYLISVCSILVTSKNIPCCLWCSDVRPGQGAETAVSPTKDDA